MKHIFILFFCLVLYKQAFTQSQEIIGTVRDALTNEGLPGANILILPGDLGAATDLDGNFKLKNIPLGRYSITVSFVGFKAKTIQAVEVTSAKQIILNVLLEEEVFSADGITISAQPKRAEVQNIFTQVGAISFSVEETRRFAGALDDPLRAAAVFPGVVQSGDVNSNGITVRGSSPKGLQWRLNGVRIPNPNHFGNVGRSDGGVTLFSTQLLANSDFLTSAFPAEYGNTTSGIFDIHYRKGNNQQREHTAQLGIQGFDLATEGPLGSESNFSYLLNYRYSIFGFLAYIEPDMKGKVPEYQDINVQIEGQTKSAGSFRFFVVAGTDNSSAKPEKDANFTIEEREDALLKNRVGIIGLTHGITLGKSSALSTTFSFVNRDVSYREGLRDSSFIYQPMLKTDQFNYTFALDQSLTQRFSEKIMYQFGYRFALDGFNTNLDKKLSTSSGLQSLANSSGITQNVETYFQTKWTISQGFSLNMGLHSMYYALTDASTLEPRISMKWDLKSGSSLALAYGNHAQLEDLSVYAMQFAGASNKTLKPIRAHHISARYGFNLMEGLHSQMDVYYQSLYNVPTVVGKSESLINHPGGIVSESYKNSGKAYSMGIEWMVEQFFLSDYYYLFSASWNQSRYKGGDSIWRNSRYSTGFTITGLGGKEWRFSPKRTLNLNLRATRTLGEFYTPIDLSQSKTVGVEVLQTNSIFTKRLPTFVYVDVSIGLKTNYATSSGEWSIQLKNSFNQRPIVAYSYNEITEQVEAQKPLGIIPILAYRYNF